MSRRLPIWGNEDPKTRFEAVWTEPLTETAWSGARFRRVFAARRGDSLRLRVTAGGRYRLWLNGRELAHGPSRSTPYHHPFRILRIPSSALRRRNLFEARVLHPGADGGLSEIYGSPAFILEAFRVNARGRRVENLSTGTEGWLAAPASDLQPHSTRPPKGYFCIGALERWSLGARPLASAWKPPVRLGIPYEAGQPCSINLPWRLVPEILPQMEETELPFSGLWRMPSGEKLPASGWVTVPSRTTARFWLTPGPHTTSFPVLEWEGGRGATADLTYAEALENEKGKIRRPLNAPHDAGPGVKLPGYSDRLEFRGGRGRWQPTRWRAFRWLEVKIRTGNTPLRWRARGHVFTSYPFRELARFECSRPEAKPVWDMCWRTLRLCAHDLFMDCPYYEQLQYAGDTGLQALISVAVSGDDRLMRQAIRGFHSSILPEGLTTSRFPTALRQVIPPFSLFWILMVADHWMWSGDASLAREVFPAFEGIFRWFRERTSPRGIPARLPWWNFVDWVDGWKGGMPPLNTAAEDVIVGCQRVVALRTAAKLAAGLGSKCQARRWEAEAGEASRALERYAWHNGRRAWSDSPGLKPNSQHAQLWSVLAGLRQRAGNGAVATLLQRDTPGLDPTAPFHDHFRLQALRALGRPPAWEDTVSFCVKTLRMGLSTCLERWIPARSDCHAWCAWPILDFTRHHLGIQHAAPGASIVRIAPETAGLAWAGGRGPTPRGLLHVEWEIAGGRRTGKATAPRGTRLVAGPAISRGARIYGPTLSWSVLIRDPLVRR
jgi:hypothetical protein